MFPQLLETILTTLRTLVASDFSETANSYPQPYLIRPPPAADFTPFDLPSVLVPPEVIDLDHCPSWMVKQKTPMTRQERRVARDFCSVIQ